MPQSYTLSSGSGSRRERARTASGSASVRSHPSVHSYSSAESWDEVDVEDDIVEGVDDGIEPEDSASRSRHTSSSRRYTTEVPIAPSRHSSRHSAQREDPPPRRHTSRREHSSRHRGDSRREPSDDSIPSVASHDDYPYGRHGMPPPRGYPPPGYRPPGHGGYAPSAVNGRPAYPDPFAHQQALVQRGQDPFAFGYTAGNPFSPSDPHGANPFSPMGSSSAAGYFATDPLGPHQRPPGPSRPQSFVAPSQYPPDMMTPYGQPYPGYPMPGYPPPGWLPYPPPPPSQPASPPPRDERDDRVEELERLKAQLLAEKNKEKEVKVQKDFEANIASMFQKADDARLAWEKQMIAKTEAEAAAKAAAAAKEEAENKRKEEVAAASKKAKEDAEKKAEEAAKKAKDEAEEAAKKAKDEADKKLQEAEKAKEEAEKKQKALEEEAAKNKPPPDHTLPPLKFKDAIGRKFSFPFHLCKTWKGMDSLIKSAFVPIDMISEHVHAGHYDLTGPDGEIILPQVWETIVKPDWDITMHMWPLPEQHPPEPPGMFQDDLFDMNYDILDPGRRPKPHKGDAKAGHKGKSKGKGMPPMPPPPPDPLANLIGDINMGGPAKKSSSKSKTKSSSKGQKVSAWFAGGSAPRGSKRR